LLHASLVTAAMQQDFPHSRGVFHGVLNCTRQVKVSALTIQQSTGFAARSFRTFVAPHFFQAVGFAVLRARNQRWVCAFLKMNVFQLRVGFLNRQSPFADRIPMVRQARQPQTQVIDDNESVDHLGTTCR
jgi:hypothetical protein